MSNFLKYGIGGIFLLVGLGIANNTDVVAKDIAPSLNPKPFLVANKAFDVSYQITQDHIVFSIKVAPDYYIYKEKLNVTIGKEQLFFDLPKGELHTDEYFGKQVIYRHKLSFNVAFEDKKQLRNIVLHYQGCADRGLCYSPKNRLLTSLRLQNTSSHINDSLFMPNEETHTHMILLTTL